ncbi:hypothetical protein VCHA38P217_30002 [Vibrio chagasii]|nr:hypothetical protein VCHA53O474_160001 [Vibrio chagasii]CAH7393495.1 hypothetical protein VCHA38P217_30002 [Vibrio chagasii]
MLCAKYDDRLSYLKNLAYHLKSNKIQAIFGGVNFAQYPLEHKHKR